MHTQWVEDETVAFNNPDAGNGTTVEAVSTGNTYPVGMWGIQMYQDDGMDCYPQYHDSADYSPVEVLAQVGAIQYQSGSNFVNTAENSAIAAKSFVRAAGGSFTSDVR
jgi:hypothetical protein